MLTFISLITIEVTFRFLRYTGNPPRANCLGSEALGVVALGGP